MSLRFGDNPALITAVSPGPLWLKVEVLLGCVTETVGDLGRFVNCSCNLFWFPSMVFFF